MVDPGKRDRRLTIEQPTLTQDATGEPVKTWSTLATVWAEKMEKSGREFFTADQDVVMADVVFRILHRDDVDETMRCVLGGKTYDIKHVAEVGRGKEQLLACKSGEVT